MHLQLFFFSIAALNVGLIQAQSTKPRSYDPESYFRPISEGRKESLTGNVIYGLESKRDSLVPPSSWQKKNDNGDYDLIIIGNGVGGSYLIKRLSEEFQRKSQPVPKIAIFERAPTVGGRLMSASGSGVLGLGVQESTRGMSTNVPQEYGGMRVDPWEHPLFYEKIVEVGQALYGKENCLSRDECRKGDNCCPNMLVPMEVGDIRYATTREDLGILSESAIFTPSESYKVIEEGRVVSSYSLQDIADGIGSPYDRCLQLALAVDTFYKNLTMDEKRHVLYSNATEDLCGICENSGIEGMCALCDAFPVGKRYEAVISCSGHDINYDAKLTANNYIIKILNIKRETNYFMLRGGFQRFAMSLLEIDPNQPGISPYFLRTLTSLSLESGENTTLLAQKQTASLSSPPQYEVVPSEKRITAHFDDGSSASAKAVYMTMLPYDLPMIEGFEPWDDKLEISTYTRLAAKIVLGWNNASEALPALLNMTACLPGPCQRLVLDGHANEGWIPRQVWLWDANTIMVYDGGMVSNNITTFPAYNMIQAAENEGMDVLVNRIMDQIRAATRVEIGDPDWARLKSWPDGTFASWNLPEMKSKLETNHTLFAAHISRPLGYDIPVYYGNSEASADASFHGWVEGSFVMVEENLQSIATYLGLKGTIGLSQEIFNKTQELAKIQGDEVAQTLSSSNSDSSSDASFIVSISWVTLFSVVSIVVMII